MDQPAKANPPAHARSTLTEFGSRTLVLDPRLWQASSVQSALDALCRYLDMLEKYNITPIVVVCDPEKDSLGKNGGNQIDNQVKSASARPKQEDGEGVERKNNAVHEKEPASEPLRVETIAKRLCERNIQYVRADTPDQKLQQLLDEGAASGAILSDQSDPILFNENTVLMGIEDDGSCRVRRRHASKPAPPSYDDNKTKSVNKKTEESKKPQSVITTRLVRRAQSMKGRVLTESTQDQSEAQGAACSKPADGLAPATHLLKRRQEGKVADASSAAVDDLIHANKENIDPQLLELSSTRPPVRRTTPKSTIRSLSSTVRKSTAVNEKQRESTQIATPDDSEEYKKIVSQETRIIEKSASPAPSASEDTLEIPETPANKSVPKKHQPERTRLPVHDENMLPEHKSSTSLKRNSVDLDTHDQAPRKRIERHLSLGDVSNRHHVF